MEKQKKLLQILQDNQQWPLMIQGVAGVNFPNAVVIPAQIPASELGLMPALDGYKYPKWVMSILVKAKKSKRVLLCIDSLDSLAMDEQEKFYGMLKYKGLNGFKFPAGLQIILATKNSANVSPKIASLVMAYQVD